MVGVKPSRDWDHVAGKPITRRILPGALVRIPHTEGQCLVVQWNASMGSFSIDVLLPDGTIRLAVTRIYGIDYEPTSQT